MLDIPGLYDEKEDVLTVIKSLSFPCYDCRLGHCQSKGQNHGIVCRGNPTAKIAIVSIMPGATEMATGKALDGKSGKLADKWFEYIKLDTNKDTFIINVVQCRPPEVEKKDGEKSQREPELDELAICFPNRCLRILRAMPNLEVITTMGWTAARCLLGGEPSDASHLGHWYVTSLLPKVAIYCLPHPAALLREPDNLDKKYKVIKCLNRFKRQYLDTKKVVGIAAKL
jgi:DNA polymerase